MFHWVSLSLESFSEILQTANFNFFHAWQTCKKAKSLDPNIYINSENFKDEYTIEARAVSCGLIDKKNP